jgi:hypothetical protein
MVERRTLPPDRKFEVAAGLDILSEAPGALPNGTPVVKIDAGPRDLHSIGARGTVVGSLKTPDELLRRFPGVPYCYFVEWADMPGVAVGVASTKIAKAPPDA